jgi:hypothetical protein
MLLKVELPGLLFNICSDDTIISYEQVRDRVIKSLDIALPIRRPIVKVAYLEDNKRIRAIRTMRKYFGLNLTEGKDFIDSVKRLNNVDDPQNMYVAIHYNLPTGSQFDFLLAELRDVFKDVIVEYM